MTDEGYPVCFFLASFLRFHLIMLLLPLSYVYYAENMNRAIKHSFADLNVITLCQMLVRCFSFSAKCDRRR